MNTSYSEDQLVEQPAIALLKELGWETRNCRNELAEGDSSPLGRETKSEVVLTARLESALIRLNPDASDAAIRAVIEELTRSRATLSPAQANWELYSLLKDGVKITVIDPDGEGETAEILQVIDWEHPEHNNFLLASQVTVVGDMYTKRPDAIGFINGIPLVLMEFKRIDENLYSAYDGNLRDYKDTIPHLLNHWKQHLDQLKSELDQILPAEQRKQLEKNIQYMEKTDMAVVVSQAQNEIGDLRRKGVEITPHRYRMGREDLDTKFKDPDDPFRIVFVCAMWSTGFDVPSCSTIYLDKPQRNHTLMQTIARANRVFGDKVNGLIVDYIGVFRNLEQALAIYATGVDAEGKVPIQDKSKLVEQLRDAIDEAKAFCANLGVDLANIDAADLLGTHRTDRRRNEQHIDQR